MRLARYSMLLALVAAASAHSVAQAATVQDQFEVRVTIEPTCTVTAGTASDIDLGSQPATGTDVTGSNTISVTCSDTTPYTVGLEPSNAATDGAGVMTGTTGDEVPYSFIPPPTSSGATPPWWAMRAMAWPVPAPDRP